MATGVAIAGAGSRVIGGRKAKRANKRARKKQRRIDEANRIRYKTEVNESVRRTEEQQSIATSQAELSSSASGFAGGSSLDRYITDMESKQKSDIDWMRSSGAEISSIMDMESAARQANMKEQGRSATFSNIAGLVSGIGNIGANYSKYGWGWG